LSQETSKNQVTGYIKSDTSGPGERFAHTPVAGIHTCAAKRTPDSPAGKIRDMGWRSGTLGWDEQ
jgi:hypothetical protein